MIVWRGWGILPILLTVAGLALGMVVADHMGMIAAARRGADASDDFANPFVALALLVVAFVNWLLGRRLNDALDREQGVPRGVVDDQERAYVRHSLAYIRFEYWSFAMAAGAVLSFVAFLRR
jgi:hypothetical protein